jgi:hypothetical protein
VAPRGKTTRVLATDPDEPETHYVPHAAKQEGLEPAHKIGLAIAGALAIIVCIVIVYVKNTKTAEMQAIQERQRAREALITELKGINLNAVGEPERLLRVVAEKETVWKGTSIAPDILSFKAKAQGALDLAKELADVTKRLEEVERDVKDPATPPAKLGDDRRKIEDLANRGSAFGDEFAKRVSVVRAQIDRVFLQRLAEEARSSPTGDLAASRVALQRFAAAEDEAKRLLDVSINLKDTEGEAHFKELYKTLVGESDRLATAAYTAEVVSQAKPRDMLSGEAATQWNPSPCKGFRAVVENGVLTIVGPDADAGKMGLVSIGDREQWRSFVAEVEFTIESGSFDFFLHLGRSANPSTVQLGIRTSGVESNVPLGKPVRAMFSMIGSKLRFRIIGEGTAEPFEKDMSWTSTRKGAIGILVPDGTRVRFTKFTVKDLR